eukprot:1657869-Prymnesium_polylepis.2
MCAHERVFIHSKLVGHARSRAWQHTMMGACFGGSQADGVEKSRCHYQKGDGKRKLWGLEYWAQVTAKSAYAKAGSPPLLEFGRLSENEDGFLPVVDTFTRTPRFRW